MIDLHISQVRPQNLNEVSYICTCHFKVEVAVETQTGLRWSKNVISTLYSSTVPMASGGKLSMCTKFTTLSRRFPPLSPLLRVLP
jgi:hypothetical protein